MKLVPVIFALLNFASPLGALELHVSPGGNDSNPGTLQQPFATITGARDAIRILKSTAQLPPGGVQIWLRGGVYPQTATVTFDHRDSGTATAPIIYASHPSEQAHVTGATLLHPDWFALVNDQSPVWSRIDAKSRGHVYAVNLRARGIADLGTLKSRGFGLSEPAPLELFVGGRPMTLARWPNRNEPLARTAAALSPVRIAYSEARPERWSLAGDVWLHGFWEHAWADFHVPMSGIDPIQKTISFGSAPAQYGTASNRPYYVYNLIEELDEPGEYYVDRATGILYVWLESPLGSEPAQVSTLQSAIMEINGAEHLRFSDLVFEASRGPLVQIVSGQHNRLERCLLRNAGQFALRIGGTGNGIDQSEIVDCNEDGALLGGGERASRSAGKNYVTNTRIHRTGRVGWTYKPGINFERGAGNIAAHNLLDDMPHSAILLAGNDHLIEFNEIRRVCQATSDAGAIYGGMDWGFRGNVIRYNYVHHIESTQEGHGAHGVYLDDCLSGVEVFGNVFYRIANAAIFCGGGRDNIVRNNIVAFAGLGHYNDDRGRNRINNTPGSSWNLLERLTDAGIRYQQDPWASAYPALAAIPNSWSTIAGGLWRNPQGSVFSNNLGWSNTTWTFESNSSGTGVFGVYASFTDNQPSHVALFDERASLDRSARPALLATSAVAFTPIPFGRMGPSADGRPAATMPPIAPILSGISRSSTRVDLRWEDRANLAKMQESGVVLEAANPDGSWQVLHAFGTDVDFVSVTGLTPGSSHMFRVRAANAFGSADSNVVAVTMLAAPATAGPATRTEAEDPLSIARDVGGNGSVGVSDGSLDSARSVRLYDAGDSIRVHLTIPVAGLYRIGARVRAGGANAATAFWPDGYHFKLDGSPVVLVGETATLSSLDESYGGCYWGTMTADLTLAAGTHSLEIASNSAWTVADFVEFSALSGAGTAQTTPTSSDPIVPLTPTRFEAETSLAVASDVGGNGSVGISDANLDSGQSVRLYDAGDAVRVSVNVAVAGIYRIRARVRSGGTTGATGFWPDGYRFKLDGGALSLAGDPLSLSAWDDAYGGCFWGTMRSGDLTLTAGTHTVEIAAATNWTVADYVELVPVSMSGNSTPAVPPAISPPSTPAPTLVVPANITAEATGAGGAVVTFATSSRDGASNTLTPTATPASGSLFPLGATTVSVSATDTAGRTTRQTFRVTVADTTKPTLTVPNDLRVEATSSNGGVVVFTTTALDSVSGVLAPRASPASGARFPLGTTTVSAFVADEAGNSATGTFRVTVSDTTPPIVSVPSNITVTAASPSGAFVPYVASATDNIDGGRPATVTPGSGSLLPIGSTTVTASASDAAGNTATKTFNVTVVRPVPAAPSGLVAVGWDGEVDLEWTPSPFALGYTITRAFAASGPFTVIARNVLNPHFTDTGLANNSTYHYAVLAVNAEGESRLSQSASATPTARTGVAAWTSSDIGAVGIAGRAAIASSAFTVWGSGADIWDTADAFQFVYQSLPGDGVITARVTHVQNTDGWAKAGVMIRETLQPNAKFAGIYLTAGNGVASQWRANSGGHCEHRSASAALPSWVRLTRSGTSITAETSADGMGWTTVSSTEIAMSSNVYVGLALTSHNNGMLASATFEAVDFKPSSSPSVTPIVPLVTTRVEAEDSLSVVRDHGPNGTVGTTDANGDSGQSVRLYDAGDTIRVSVLAPTAGAYRLAARVRSGGSTGAMVFWPSGYHFKLDGSVIVLSGDATSVSAREDAYGGCYWGTMLSATISLGAGTHTLEISAASPWAVADYVEISQINP